MIPTKVRSILWVTGIRHEKTWAHYQDCLRESGNKYVYQSLLFISVVAHATDIDL